MYLHNLLQQNYLLNRQNLAAAVSSRFWAWVREAEDQYLMPQASVRELLACYISRQLTRKTDQIQVKLRRKLKKDIPCLKINVCSTLYIRKHCYNASEVTEMFVVTFEDQEGLAPDAG